MRRWRRTMPSACSRPSGVKATVGDAATCPHGHPIQPGRRIEGVPLADVEVGAKVRILRFENEAEDLLHYLKAHNVEPGRRGPKALADLVKSEAARLLPILRAAAEK